MYAIDTKIILYWYLLFIYVSSLDTWTCPSRPHRESASRTAAVHSRPSPGIRWATSWPLISYRPTSRRLVNSEWHNFDIKETNIIICLLKLATATAFRSSPNWSAPPPSWPTARCNWWSSSYSPTRPTNFSWPPSRTAFGWPFRGWRTTCTGAKLPTTNWNSISNRWSSTFGCKFRAIGLFNGLKTSSSRLRKKFHFTLQTKLSLHDFTN